MQILIYGEDDNMIARYKDVLRKSNKPQEYTITSSNISLESFQCLQKHKHNAGLIIFIQNDNAQHSIAFISVARECKTPIIVHTDTDNNLRIAEECTLLSHGADDVLRNEQSDRVLLLRVENILRRTKAPPTPIQPPSILEIGDIKIDKRKHTVHVKNRSVRLPSQQFDVLCYMVESGHHVRSREDILEHCFPNQGLELIDRTVDSMFKKLRKNLKPAGISGGFFETIYGVGYKITEDTGLHYVQEPTLSSEHLNPENTFS